MELRDKIFITMFIIALFLSLILLGTSITTGLFGAKSGIPEMEDITMYIQFSPGTYFWIIFFSITTILIIAMGVAYYKAKNKHGIKR